MRVVGGSKRGTQLIGFDREEVRPTLDRVKESMFNIIQFERCDNVLDLFAGTGQLGIECISRGAVHAVFCDNAKESLDIVRKNLKKTGFEDKAKVLLCDYKRFLKYEADREYDVIFVDPPYDAGLYEPVLNTLVSVDNLSDGGIIICEARRETELPELPVPYRKGKEYRYGKVKICIYTKESQL